MTPLQLLRQLNGTIVESNNNVTNSIVLDNSSLVASLIPEVENNSPMHENIKKLLIEETEFEKISDLVLGIAFLITSFVAAKRMIWSRKQGGTETTVVTAFYSLILITSILRALWFLIPSATMEPSYTPSAVMAYSKSYHRWLASFMAELLQSIGSMCLFSIFILILVYWEDILKKYFNPATQRTRPMRTFLHLTISLAALELLNALLFLKTLYSIEGMILFNAILLASISVICVIQITRFSHRFRKVLKTLGAINQVSTESQVKRIVWITATGNLFFFTRAFLETLFTIVLIIYWSKHGSVDKVFSHSFWDSYILCKHWSEEAILCLMLYILQSRFAGSSTVVSQNNNQGYQPVTDVDNASRKTPGNTLAV